MPIMAAQGRNDARTAARLLALTALDCLEDRASAPEQTVALNNVYRLLDAYRSNPFFGLGPATNYYSHGETLALIPPLEQYVGAVRDVIEQAMLAAFGGQSKDEAVSEIEAVLKGVAYPEFGEPSPGIKAKARRFFSEIVGHL